jgi:hypothetical protein
LGSLRVAITNRGKHMAKALPLSQQLQSYIDTFDSERERDILPEERDWAEVATKFLDLMTGDIISSRESVRGKNPPGIEGVIRGIERFVRDNPEDVRFILDNRFTRQVVDAIPGYVARILKLSRLESSREASEATNNYLNEAVRTYIFGFPKASIALSRAALEQALKEELGHQGRRIYIDMNDLLDEAEGAGIIDSVIRKTARNLSSEAGNVLHEELADLPKAYEILLMLRGVLQHIYGN